MTDDTRPESPRRAHRRAEPVSTDLEPEVDRTWLRPRGRARLEPGTASSADPAGAHRPTGRRANAVLDAEAEAAERLAADRATLAAQGEAIRRAAEHRRQAPEAPPVRPRATIQQDPGADDARRLVAGGVFDGPLSVAPASTRATAQAVPGSAGPDEIDEIDEATRAIAVVRPTGPGRSTASDAPAVPFRPDRTLVMGILNVTLDSFSDGGRYARFDDAIAHARSMVADGADVIDIGGESTRPGAARVEVHEEQRRVIPVIRELVSLGMRVSIDTMNAATAFAAVEAGADIINDVSGGLADANMAQVAKDTDVTYIAMHWRGHSDSMQQRASYRDAVAEVRAELFQRVGELVVQGVSPDRLVIDPGLGFAKLAAHNWQILGHFDSFAELGLPVLVAASRKRFLGALLPEDAGVAERDPATAVISALGAQAGAWAVRVHDVASTRAALDVWEAWQKGSHG